MRLSHAVMVVVAVTSMLGCVRFGYDALRAPSEPTPDAAHGGDAGRPDGGMDAAVGMDAGGQPDAGASDASTFDASVRDAATPVDAAAAPADAAAVDAARPIDDAAAPVPDSGAMPNDAAVQMPIDSGAVDAAVSDAAMGDAAVDLCPERSDALFCDGFEDPTFARWSYTVVNNGLLTRIASPQPVHTGTAALRAATTSKGSKNAARYGVRALPQLKSGEIWARYYYYLISSITVTKYFSTGVVAEGESPYFGFALLIAPARVDIGVGSTMYRGTEGVAFPRDHWTCIELHVKIDATAGYFEAYLDSALAVRSPATNTVPAMGYSTLDVGIHYTDPGQDTVVAFVDDVVAGTSRVGCN